jgi:hypothetical protein
MLEREHGSALRSTTECCAFFEALMITDTSGLLVVRDNVRLWAKYVEYYVRLSIVDDG